MLKPLEPGTNPSSPSHIKFFIVNFLSKTKSPGHEPTIANNLQPMLKSAIVPY